MTALGCPYAAGPACRDCDGGCWDEGVDHCPSCPFAGCDGCKHQPEGGSERDA